MGEPLPVMQPVNTEREDVNDAERQQQNIPQQQDAQDIGDMLVEEEILDQEEMHVPISCCGRKNVSATVTCSK